MMLKVGLADREQLKLNIDVDPSGTILAAQIQGIGGPDLLASLPAFRRRLSGKLSEVQSIQQSSPAALLFNELLARVRGEFILPYQEQELCHCRAISTDRVDHAIVYGAHSPKKVSRWTSASTACGTCRCDVEKLIKFRLMIF